MCQRFREREIVGVSKLRNINKKNYLQDVVTTTKIRPGEVGSSLRGFCKYIVMHKAIETTAVTPPTVTDDCLKWANDMNLALMPLFMPLAI